MSTSADPGVCRVLERKEEDTIRKQTEREFRGIFEKYHHSVQIFFIRRGFTEEESRDLTQDTFLRVLKSMESLREARKPKAWVYTIASNLYKNELRSRQAEKRAADEVSLEAALDQGQPVFQPDREGPDRRPDAGPLETLLEDERSRLLYEALTTLPNRMRRCVRLRLEQDLKYKDIAALMGTSVETVKAQLFQARKRLQEVLQGHFENIDF